MRSSVLLAVLLLAGCSVTETLEPRFFPLQEIREVPDWPLEEGRVSTIYGTCYTRSVAAIDSRYPRGSVEREAVLRHEQVHSIRQFQDPLWLAKYVASSAFRLQEEEAGERVEILWLRDHQAPVYPESVAWALATGYGGIVTYEDALSWVEGVLREP